MIKKQVSFASMAALIAVAMGMTSCKHDLNAVVDLNEGLVISENRALKGFEKIEINGSPCVNYIQADSFSVRIEGTESGIKNLITEVDGKTLCLRNRGKISVVNITVNGGEDVSVHVTSPDLTGISLNGSGYFTSNKRIDTDKMDIALHGSGDIKVKDLICDDCRVELVGSGNIDVDQLEARRMDASLIGSGDIGMKLHQVESTILSLKGSGDIDAEFVEGCGSVANELRGSGDINLKGVVRQFKQQKSGSGDIDVHKLAIQK